LYPDQLELSQRLSGRHFNNTKECNCKYLYLQRPDWGRFYYCNEFNKFREMSTANHLAHQA